VTVAQAAPPVVRQPASLGALQQGTLDVSATIGDVVQTGITTVASNPTPESQGISSVLQASGVLRIIFRLP